MSDTNRHKLIIIGCGASGMAAAISAAVYEKDILILERNPVPGKKIPATGNGKCNFTNLNIEQGFLRSSSGDPFSFCSRFDSSDTLRFFERLGIPAYIRNGYCYPASGQAASVRDALYLRITELGIHVEFDTRVTAITKNDSGFVLAAGQKTYFCEKLIIAAGGEASPCFGTDGSFYYICKKLGHSVIQPLPALVGLILSHNRIKELTGVRQEARISLRADDKELYTEAGEIIFNKTGISGIPVMNSARFAAYALNDGQTVSLSIDFFPDMSSEQLKAIVFDRYMRGSSDIFKSLTGVLNDKLIAVILERCGVNTDFSSRGSDAEAVFGRIVSEMKSFILTVSGTAGFENAQTTAGGIPLSELNPETMESTVCPGLYIVGELADVDGICGGYNLQWAWATGVIAGACAGGGRFDKSKFFEA